MSSLGHPDIGETVIAWAPIEARTMAAARGYLPANVPLVKPVAAIPGDRVCATNDLISVNGAVVAVRTRRDGRGRWMPWWSGCRRLRGDELFLLSADVPQAWDGRYFGISKGAELIGKAQLLWVR